MKPGCHMLIGVKMENDSQWELKLWWMSQSGHTMNWKSFDFSLTRFSTVDIYEKRGYGFGTISWKSFKTLGHPKRPWECVHLLLEMFIGEIPWKVQQQEVVLIILNKMRAFISFTSTPQNSSAHSKKSLQSDHCAGIHIFSS